MNRIYTSYGISFKFYLLVLILLIASRFVKAQTPINEGKLSSQTIMTLVEESETEAIVIGILGKDYNLLQNLKRQISASKSSKTIKVIEINDESEIRNCEITYITSEYLSERSYPANQMTITVSKTDKTDYRLAYNDGKMDLFMNQKESKQAFGH